MNRPDCHRCKHIAHENLCRTITISGPPSLEGKKVGDGYEHTGRTETPCECMGYIA